MKFFDLRIKTRKCSNSFVNNLQIRFNGNALRTTLKVLALNDYALSFLEWKKKLQVFQNILPFFISTAVTHEVLDKQGWGCPVGDIIANIMTKNVKNDSLFLLKKNGSQVKKEC